MFVIITYDITDMKRLNRTRKLLRKYLEWTQNSVFKGEITESNLKKCLNELNQVICKNEDSIYLYKVKNINNIKKELVGIEKVTYDIFL